MDAFNLCGGDGEGTDVAVACRGDNEGEKEVWVIV